MQYHTFVNQDFDQFLTTAEAAKLIGLAAQTLASDRVSRRLKIPFCKFGASVRYSRLALITWTEQHVRT